MPRLALAVFLCAAIRMSGIQTQCITCHPAETKLHTQTRMAHAMTPALTSTFAQHLAEHPLHEAPGGFEFSYDPAGDGVRVTVKRGNESASGIIEWVLGAGAQGQTPVVRVGESLFESRVSYFTRLHQYGITIGQPAGPSRNADAALGLEQSKRDANSCLMCHSTGVTDSLEPVIPGVQCERCHAGAAEHAAGKGPVTNPGKLSARAQIEVCSVCHRIKAPVDDSQPENVRFQPLRLIKSRCFASGQLACTTCHPAHLDAKRDDPAFYNERCNTCHATPKQGQHADARRTGDCIGCHMAVVALHPGLKFTDHYIRILSKSD